MSTDGRCQNDLRPMALQVDLLSTGPLAAGFSHQNSDDIDKPVQVGEFIQFICVLPRRVNSDFKSRKWSAKVR